MRHDITWSIDSCRSLIAKFPLMSSSSSPASTATSLLPSTTDGPGETTGGVNYFFGFLLTFVGLLILFILCGIGSRRRFTSRRELNYALEGRSSNGKIERGETPQFYEPSFVVGEDKWSGLMPLSVGFFREDKESDSIVHDLQAVPPPTPAPARPDITGQVYSWFNNDPSLQTQADREPPDTIQVAVMIIMPRGDVSPTNPQAIPEYQIGEISLPWGPDP